jgi:3-oxoacyl-[acyl-carrier protein] reductase
MDFGLADKRVLVTGASRGIGRAIVEGFLCEGAQVAFVARTPGPLEKMAEQLTEAYGPEQVLPLKADCTNPEEWKRIRDAITDAWGGLEVVVANVGDGRSVPDALPEDAHFAKVWQTNFTSAEQTARATLPFLEASNGCMLFISSIAGLEAIGAPTGYSVAKTALVALSKQLARKLAPQVRVNCIAPGNVFFSGGSWDEKLQADRLRVEQLIEATVPLKRFCKPEEIADAALFLCSNRACFITGAVLRIDGGQTVGIF